jgi:hypothetical protein
MVFMFSPQVHYFDFPILLIIIRTSSLILLMGFNLTSRDSSFRENRLERSGRAALGGDPTYKYTFKTEKCVTKSVAERLIKRNFCVGSAHGPCFKGARR